MKKIPFLAMITFLLAAALPAAHADEKIRIGVSTALTGNAAPYGVDLKNSLLFANEKLAGNKYDLVFDDDKCDGLSAVSVAHHFIDISKIKYASGFACSSTVLSTVSIYKRAHIPMVVVTASASAISKVGVFRTWPNDADAAHQLFAYVASKHKRIGVLTEETDYAQGFWHDFTEGNKDGHVEIFNEDYLTSATDYRSVLLKLKEKNTEGLFINSQTDVTFLAVLKQVKQLHWNVPIYGAYWGGTHSFLTNAKELAEGITFVDLPSPGDVMGADGLALMQEFRQKYGELKSVDLIFATSFEGFRALHQAIEHGGDFDAYMHATTFHGIFGDWSFDANGDIRGLKCVMKTVRNGKAAPL